MSRFVEPDLEFIRYIKNAGGDTLKKCYQCATCSVVCPLSQEKKPFPRREMLLAQWGRKEDLMGDTNIMLCHQCGDCNTYCPRGANPGNVLGALRAYVYTYFGFPQGLSRLASDGKNIPILIGVPAMLILFVWYLSGGMHIPAGVIDFGLFFGGGHFFGLTKTVLIIDAIMLPTLFFSLYASYRGVTSMWKRMCSEHLINQPIYRPTVFQFIVEFFWPAAREIIQHTRFKKCVTNSERIIGHLPLVFSFVGLFIVTNYSFVRKDIFGLFYPSLHAPISLTDPFKILANLSAVAFLFGIIFLLINRRIAEKKTGVKSSFYDLFLIGVIFAVGITGIVSEISRLAEFGLVSYISYYMHLVSVFMLFIYMPYTKMAHLVYRTVAMAFERYRQSAYMVQS